MRSEGSRSRVEGDKRAERSEIEHGPCHFQKQLDGCEHGSGVEVSGSAVSIPRGESRPRDSESRHPFQAPPFPRCCRAVDELPSEGTTDASPNCFGVVGPKRATRLSVRVRTVNWSGPELLPMSGDSRQIEMKGCPKEAHFPHSPLAPKRALYVRLNRDPISGGKALASAWGISLPQSVV